MSEIESFKHKVRLDTIFVSDIDIVVATEHTVFNLDLRHQQKESLLESFTTSYNNLLGVFDESNSEIIEIERHYLDSYSVYLQGVVRVSQELDKYNTY